MENVIDNNSRLEMMNVKGVKPSFSRRPEDRAKFGYLVRLLVHFKDKTGLPSGEIVNALLTKGKSEINWSVSHSL